VLTWKLWIGALTNVNPATTITPDTSPRGIKRSRSPDTYGDLPTGDILGDDGTSSFDPAISISLHSNVRVAIVAMLHVRAADGRNYANDDLSLQVTQNHESAGDR
jgi:hypothetical protein